MPYRLACNQVFWRHFLIWGSLLLDDFSLSDIKLSSTACNLQMISRLAVYGYGLHGNTTSLYKTQTKLDFIIYTESSTETGEQPYSVSSKRYNSWRKEVFMTIKTPAHLPSSPSCRITSETCLSVYKNYKLSSFHHGMICKTEDNMDVSKWGWLNRPRTERMPRAV